MSTPGAAFGASGATQIRFSGTTTHAKGIETFTSTECQNYFAAGAYDRE
jgi:hypothetical protein